MDQAPVFGLRHHHVSFAEGASGAEAAYLAFLDGAMQTEFLAPFGMNLAIYSLGSLRVVRATATRRATEMGAELTPDTAPDVMHVQLILAGAAHGNAAGRPVASLPNTVMLLDNRQPFRIVDDATRTCLDIAVPRHMLHAENDPADFHGVVLSGGPARLLITFMTDLAEAIDTLPAAAGPPLATAFLALLSVAIGDEAAFAESEGKAARMLARMERHVDFKLTSPELGPEWLARRLNVSRSELYGLLQPFGGVRRFITARRLAAAKQALTDLRDHRRIAEIAFSVGFQSEAHFSRAYKSQFGQSPSQTRAAVAMAAANRLKRP